MSSKVWPRDLPRCEQESLGEVLQCMAKGIDEMWEREIGCRSNECNKENLARQARVQEEVRKGVAREIQQDMG